MNRQVFKVALLLFGSGLCALIYQTAWLREFRLIFGASTAATAAVLAIFMGGLGVGGAVLGRRADRQSQPLAFYGRLELMIALAAALTPLLIWLVRLAYQALGGTQVLGLGLGTGLRLVFSTLVLGLPTFLMGGTLPAAARAVESEDDLGRRRLALLYGVNTLGAVGGAALSTFLLLESLGNRLTLWSACAVNVVIALIAIKQGRSGSFPGSTVAAAPVKIASDAAEIARAAPPGFVLAASAIVGFAFLLMELVWYRMLSPLLGGSTFTFGLILAVALLGIGLGGAVYAILGSRRPATLMSFAITCMLEALCIAYPYALGDRIAILTALLRPLGSFEFYGHVAAWTFVACIVALPAAMVAGFQFPLLIGLLGRGGQNVGRHTGLAYAWNTAGAIAGSLAGGFGVLPLLTAPGTWRLVVALLVLLGFAALFLTQRDGRSAISAASSLALGAMATVLMFSVGPTAAWRHSPIGAGRVGLDEFESRNSTQSWLEEQRRQIHWQAEGRETCVAVEDTESFSFLVNGKSDGNARGDAGTQVMSGLIGAILHPKPVNVLVVGLGTGSTAGWLGSIPSVERLDVVELEQSILQVAAMCSNVNMNVLANPKVHPFIGDGREVVLTTRQNYDLIVSEPSNPYRAGIAGLFTREYYATAARKLNEGGMFLQWLQAYETDAATVRTAFATLTSVFPYLESWITIRNDLLFVASMKPISYDVPALRARIKLEPFKTALADVWRVSDLEGVFAHYLANEDFSRLTAQTPPIRLNTDDRMLLEFAYARSVGTESQVDLSDIHKQARARRQHQPKRVTGDLDWFAVLERRASMSVVDGETPEIPRLPGARSKRISAVGRYAADDLTGTLTAWREQTTEPQDLVQVTMLAEALAEAGDDKALGYIQKLRESQPVEADAILAHLRWRQDKPAEATTALEAAFIGYRQNPWPNRALMDRTLDMAADVAEADENLARRLFQSLEKRFAASCVNQDRLSTRIRIAEAISDYPLTEYALQAIQAYEPYPVWKRDWLAERSECYAHFKHPDAARAAADFALFNRNDPALLLENAPEKAPTKTPTNSATNSQANTR